MRYLIGLVALLFCWQAGTLKSAAQEPPATVAGGTLVAEKLHYDISFLWLNRAAEGLFAVSSGLREFELSGDQIRHGDQVVRISVASRFGLGRLNEAVNPFQEAVGQA